MLDPRRLGLGLGAAFLLRHRLAATMVLRQIGEYLFVHVILLYPIVQFALVAKALAVEFEAGYGPKID